MKKYLKYLLIFIIPILLLNSVLIIKYGIKGIYNQFIVEDLNSQYISLINWLTNVLHGKENLFYSFSKGIGGNMFSTFAYYLSSPLNLILLFFKTENIIVAIYLLINIKIGLSALTMFIYLKNKFKNNKYIWLIIFSLIYSLSGVVINFYSNIMWLDIYYLTPIVMLGLEKIIKKESNYIYVISLSLAMISNFYMAYILCVFCVIYFIYFMVINYSKKYIKIIKSIIKKFILSSLLSALISSIILIPTIYDMASNMFRYEINKPIFYFDLKAIPMIFSKLFIGSMGAETMFSHNEANIYICLFSLILVIAYLFNKKVKNKERIITTIVICIFILSILCNALSLVWHGFSFPNGYNYRFVYFWPFFITSVAYQYFHLIVSEKKQKKKFKFFDIYIPIIIMIIIVAIVIDRYSYLSLSEIVITVIFILLYSIIFLFKKYNSKIIKLILIILIIAELCININYSFVSKNNVNKWYEKEYSAHALVNIPFYIEELCSKIKKIDYKRIDSFPFVSYNDSLLCSNKSLNTALSTNHARYYKFLNNSGYVVTYSTIYNDYLNGAFIDSILGVEYMLEKDSKYQPYYIYSDSYNISNKKEKLSLEFTEYYNPYVLNIGYIVNGNASIKFNKNAFEYQNKLAQKMSGLDINIFEKVDTKEIKSNKENSQTLSFYVEDKEYYIYNYVPTPINNTYYGDLKIGNREKMTYAAGNNGIIDLGEYFRNINIEVTYTAKEEYKDYIDLQIYSFNKDNFELIINKLKENQLNVTKMHKNTLEGNINITQDNSLLMITVPYEKGWNIYVDGKKVDYEEVYDTFIGIHLNKGDHEIKMVFYSPGIILGSIMSIVGIYILIKCYIDDKNKLNKKTRK